MFVRRLFNQLNNVQRVSSSTHLRSGRSYSTAAADLHAGIAAELTTRRIPLIYDDLTPGSSVYLAASLAPYLPASWTSSDISLPIRSYPQLLPPAHHLVYFNPAITADKLLLDGTDPLQSPGPPFVRRMWAGGSLRFNAARTGNMLLDGKRYVCVEGIRDVNIKGVEGDERVYVGIERRFGSTDDFFQRHPQQLANVGSAKAGNGALGSWGQSDQHPSDEDVRNWLWAEDENDSKDALLVERRNIVFMREKTRDEASKSATKIGGKILKPTHAPDFSHTLVPPASLLFRYSALTFNAHRIHLDTSYCRQIEGHRNLLVHGPLQFTLLVTMLQGHLRQKFADVHPRDEPRRLHHSDRHTIQSIDYRNLAPLYADERLRLCGKEVQSGRYELWAETPEGGMAVRMTAWTQDAPRK